MPTGPAIPDTAVAAIRRYGENKIPANHRAEVRVEYGVRGKSVTIYECRPPWHPNLGPGCRWHFYGMTGPTPKLDELITEIDQDPTGIFWGRPPPTMRCSLRGRSTSALAPRGSGARYAFQETYLMGEGAHTRRAHQISSDGHRRAHWAGTES
jgi:hypothetical protein